MSILKRPSREERVERTATLPVQVFASSVTVRRPEPAVMRPATRVAPATVRGEPMSSLRRSPSFPLRLAATIARYFTEARRPRDGSGSEAENEPSRAIVRLAVEPSRFEPISASILTRRPA